MRFKEECISWPQLYLIRCFGKRTESLRYGLCTIIDSLAGKSPDNAASEAI